jgi:hypothetical protein
MQMVEYVSMLVSASVEAVINMPSAIVEFITANKQVGAAIAGGATSAVLGGLFALFIAKRITLQLKMIDNTLEFSKRFGELLKEQGTLNKTYKTCITDKTPQHEEAELEEAMVWWWRFFDLMLYEYDFFRNGLLWDARFAMWMVWRWLDYNDETKTFTTNGMGYRDGWSTWSKKPANVENRFVKFLEQIHKAADRKEVEAIVKSAAPRFWRHARLD